MDNVLLTSLVFDKLRDQPGEVAVATADQQDASEDFDWGTLSALAMNFIKNEEFDDFMDNIDETKPFLQNMKARRCSKCCNIQIFDC